MRMNWINSLLFFNSSALVMALDRAVRDAQNNTLVSPKEAHDRIKTMYTWQNVARRTERVRTS